jgi:hypothetical protein
LTAAPAVVAKQSNSDTATGRLKIQRLTGPIPLRVSYCDGVPTPLTVHGSRGCSNL